MNIFKAIFILQLMSNSIWALSDIDLSLELGVNTFKTSIKKNEDQGNIKSSPNSFFNFSTALYVDEYLSFGMGYKQFTYAFTADSDDDVNNSIGVNSSTSGNIKWKMDILAFMLGFSSDAKTLGKLRSNDEIDLDRVNSFNWLIGSDLTLAIGSDQYLVLNATLLNKLMSDDIKSFFGVDSSLKYQLGNNSFNYFFKGNYLYEQLKTDSTTQNDHIITLSVGLGV